jgi:uncharacterized protein (UPF0276 family)
MLAAPPPVGWVEVHAENYLAAGGPRLAALERIRCDVPLSIHGVGLSMGSAGGIDAAHLDRLVRLVDRFQPALVSEHVAWSVNGGVYFNDLLPIPYTEETLALLCRAVDRVQTALGRQILMENPSTYVRFAASTIPEPEFIAELAARTGCGLLLDVNNIQVSAVNHGFDPYRYLSTIPARAVQEIHLAGHAVLDIEGEVLLVDDHGSPVSPEVWRLYAAAIERVGPMPTLIEWDTRIPPLATLVAEARRADVWLAGAVARSRVLPPVSGEGGDAL